MNSLAIHNVNKISLTEIRDLSDCYSMNIIIDYNLHYEKLKDDTKSKFEITLFSENRKSLEQIKFFIPIENASVNYDLDGNDKETFIV